MLRLASDAKVFVQRRTPATRRKKFFPALDMNT